VADADEAFGKQMQQEAAHELIERPASRHNLVLQRRPSLSAAACNWFMTRVRACTMRCRCHSSCRRSRFSQLGTQICGKSSFNINLRISCASWRSVFCLRTHLVPISAASPIHNSKFSSASSRSNQRDLPKIDLPETAFDETDSPTIQTILMSKASSFQQCSPLGAAIVPMAYAGMAKARGRNISQVCAAQSSESRQSQSISILRC
jgi:hypothetical protein